MAPSPPAAIFQKESSLCYVWGCLGCYLSSACSGTVVLLVVPYNSITYLHRDFCFWTSKKYFWSPSLFLIFSSYIHHVQDSFFIRPTDVALHLPLAASLSAGKDTARSLQSAVPKRAFTRSQFCWHLGLPASRSVVLKLRDTAVSSQPSSTDWKWWRCNWKNAATKLTELCVAVTLAVTVFACSQGTTCPAVCCRSLCAPDPSAE